MVDLHLERIRKNEIVAICLFTIGVFLSLSIFTFTEQDLSLFTTSPNAAVQNVMGIAGAYIGGILLFLLGKAAYILPLLILVWGISSFCQVEPKKNKFKLLGASVLIIAASSGLAIMANLSPTASFKFGGLVGTYSSFFLVEYLGKVGALIFIIAIVVLSLLIATEFLILPIFVAIFNLLRTVFSKGKPLAVEWAQGFSQNIMARMNKVKNAKGETSKKLEDIRRQVEEVRRVQIMRSASKREKDTLEKAKKINDAAPVNIEKVAVKNNISDSPRETSDAKESYNLPSVVLLRSSRGDSIKGGDEDLKKKAAILERTLSEFEVEAKVVKVNKGPVITMYELEPAVGTKVNKITSLNDNISLAMKSSNMRIVAPLPGKGTIGIEVPNEKCEFVRLRDVLESKEYADAESPLKLALGKDILGVPIVTDLAKCPHLLVAGATGSGKTVCLNSIISSFLYSYSPDALKFLMIDPKRVELMIFEGIPHLISPIVTNPKKAASVLEWVVGEMERRYELFAEKGVRNIAGYKERHISGDEDLPYIVTIVDELADLMMVAQQDIEGAIMRIAQLSRAAGIHMILATQRPSVNVITGVIKANFPARISFKVASKVDSRTVLDANGAEKLLGKGDMLLMEPGEASLIRGQCSLVEDAEIRDIVKFIKSQRTPCYLEEIIKRQEKRSIGATQQKDELYDEAVRIVMETKQASASMLQRKLRVGYSRAARMIDIMEEEGLVSPSDGAKARQILADNIEAVRE